MMSLREWAQRHLPSFFPRKEVIVRPRVACWSSCPKCGSGEYTQRLTDWVIGYGVKNNGMTQFTKTCRRCGHEWTERLPSAEDVY